MIENDPSETIRESTRRSRRLRFGLRTLLFVMIPVAAGSVWFAMRFEKAKRQRQVVDWVLNDQRGHVHYDCEYDHVPSPTVPNRVNLIPRSPGPKWAENLLGIDFFVNVRSIILDNQEIHDLSPLLQLPELRTIGICIEVWPDANLSSLAELKNLEELAIDYGQVQQADLDVIRKALPNCKISLGPEVVLK